MILLRDCGIAGIINRDRYREANRPEATGRYDDAGNPAHCCLRLGMVTWITLGV